MTRYSSDRYNNIAFAGMFAAVSIVLGSFENFFPLPVPGVRLGLANVGIMLMLYTGGVKAAGIVAVLKILTVPVLSGNMLFRLSIGVPSGVVSFIAMAFIFTFLYKLTTPVSAGIVGSISHMVCQLFVIDKLYIPGIFGGSVTGWFCLFSVLTGLLTGIVTFVVLKRVKFFIPYQKNYS